MAGRGQIHRAEGTVYTRGPRDGFRVFRAICGSFGGILGRLTYQRLPWYVVGMGLPDTSGSACCRATPNFQTN